MNKAKFLASIAGTSLVALGGSFVSESAQAVTLQQGDFIILDIGFRASDTFNVGDGIIDTVSMRDGLGGFVDPNGSGVFTVTNSQLGGVTGVAVGDTGSIRSFDLADTNFFTILPPLDTSFDPFVQNTLTVDASFQPLWTLDLGGGDMLEYDLNVINTTQTTPLSTTAPTTVNFSGTGFLISDNQRVGLANFTAAAVFNPTLNQWETDGGLVVQVQAVGVPEPGTIVGLLALSGLGLGLKLKKQS